MSPPVVYRRNPQTAGRVIDGLAFIVTPDNNKLHSLNATATLLWQLADTGEGCTTERCAEELVARYEVDEATALCDAESCLRDLVARQILVVASSALSGAPSGA